MREKARAKQTIEIEVILVNDRTRSSYIRQNLTA